MGKIKDLTISIQEDIAAGMEWGEIARFHKVSLNWVAEAAAMMNQVDDSGYDDPMDGDAASALASVGWGTDEDYGSFGDDF